jgi:hypothetical protein
MQDDVRHPAIFRARVGRFHTTGHHRASRSAEACGHLFAFLTETVPSARGYQLPRYHVLFYRTHDADERVWSLE